jgi:hypothetical protein
MAVRRESKTKQPAAWEPTQEEDESSHENRGLISAEPETDLFPEIDWGNIES